MRRTWLVGLLTLAALGCDAHDVYELRLEPTASGLRRTLTAWHEDGDNENQSNKPLAAEKLKHLATLYSERLSGDNDIRQTFRGTFLGKLPADIGGHGTYEVVRTPLGASYVYLERFRGNIDVDAELYDRRAAVDRMCDLLVGFFDLHLKDAPERAQVHKFLHQEFRQDARNLAVLAWTAGYSDSSDLPAPTEEGDPRRVDTVLVRLLEYVEEHDYTTLQELRAGIGDSAQMFPKLRRMLTRKCGLDPATGEKLFAFLRESEELQESWNEYLRRTPEYEQLRKQARAAKRTEGQPSKDPEPNEVVNNVLRPLGPFFEFSGSRDELRLTLLVGAAPFETNGRWTAEENCVSWAHRLHDHVGTATVCYAAWSVADEAFQTAHFGRAAVRDKPLAEFAALYQALSAPQREEVDKHLAALEPGDAIKGRVQDFRFVGPADEAAQAAARRIVEVLAGCL